MKVVYVASAISIGDLTANIRAAHTAAMALLRAGFVPWVPHGSCFFGNATVTWRDANYNARAAFVPQTNPDSIPHHAWLAMSLELVRRCDIVLRLPGESKGADLEVELARSLGKPVYYSVEELVYAETQPPEPPARGIPLPIRHERWEDRQSENNSVAALVEEFEKRLKGDAKQP